MMKPNLKALQNIHDRWKNNSPHHFYLDLGLTKQEFFDLFVTEIPNGKKEDYLKRLQNFIDEKKNEM